MSNNLEARQEYDTDKLQAQFELLLDRNKALEEEIAKTNDYSKMLEARITALEDVVANMRQRE